MVPAEKTQSFGFSNEVESMNLRSLTLKYLGWCPGVESAARFIPERDVSNKTVIALAISFTSIIIVGLFAAQNLLIRPASGPLEI